MNETTVRVVDNRVLILGLDALYRDAMMEFEVDRLLPAAKKLIKHLNVETLDVPIEGYYTSNSRLKEYFLIMRTLQQLGSDESARVENTDEYRFISKIVGSPLYGRQSERENFFPVMKDPLYLALSSTSIDDWNAEILVEKAYGFAIENDDFSLVGLGSLSRDPVLVTAFRESTVLYAETFEYGAAYTPPQFSYEWRVDEEIEEKTNRFIALFKELTAAHIPSAKAENADYFYDAFRGNEILGRCVRIAFNSFETPVRHYHWAINSRNREFLFDEFWDTKHWTTELYKQKQLYRGRFNENINQAV